MDIDPKSAHLAAREIVPHRASHYYPIRGILKSANCKSANEV